MLDFAGRHLFITGGRFLHFWMFGEFIIGNFLYRKSLGAGTPKTWLGHCGG
jgi:hypothetical protein